MLVAAALAAAVTLPARAQTVAEKAQLCSGCHGANGTPSDKTWPVISGQQLGYLYLQLRDFKSGARKSELMAPIAAALDHDEMLALAGYFSKQPWPGLRPRLAGQARAYLASTMLDFRNNTRGNNPGMTDLMLATSESDIAALAEYLAGL
jgi:cytochrome c553